MKVVSYNSSYKVKLASLLIAYFREVEPNRFTGSYTRAVDMIANATAEGRTIYVLVDGNDVPIGFLIAYINDQFKMSKPYVVCEYMYIDPTYRSTLAPMYMYYMLGKICDDYEYDGIGITYNNSSNINNNERLGGKPLATTYTFDLETIRKHYNKYKRRIER